MTGYCILLARQSKIIAVVSPVKPIVKRGAKKKKGKKKSFTGVASPRAKFIGTEPNLLMSVARGVENKNRRRRSEVPQTQQ